ncbi:hypothetical protein BDV25DRAFT_158509 [Aspergillus avenaceus]|uniref:Secreted protein n=1 Tax=Aspergillus avenaceus TaxID=36643 RepID=A0A5N6TPR0_ASPAV|nr:hypothetical protein BDV25DRAFT_158509 [Aspergillus avenaceus]
MTVSILFFSLLEPLQPLLSHPFRTSNRPFQASTSWVNGVGITEFCTNRALVSTTGARACPVHNCHCHPLFSGACTP